MFITPLASALFGLLPLIGGYAYEHSQNVITQAIPAAVPAVTINYLNVLAREDGFSGIFVGILFAVVAATGYRKGQRWAWYAMMWVFVMNLVGTFTDMVLLPLPGEAVGANALVLMLLLLMAAGLALPYRMFFPKSLPSGRIVPS